MVLLRRKDRNNEGLFGHGSSLAGHTLTDGIDEDDGEDGEDGEDDQEDLEVLLKLPTEVDGVQATLLETGGSIFMMVVVVMMFGH